VDRFHELRALGVKIALDDFGTRLQLAVVPALAAVGHAQDRQAVHRRPAQRPPRDHFVGMIVDLARTLELEVIAEGIETAEQLAALRELRAGLGQGYFLGRPPPPRRACGL
jgi:EAL domain-containing protein (putative c-di-GMP-specific phosphodiesterase class I)